MDKVFENRVGGIEKLTLLDFPNHLSAILFYNGCNLRCPYCYNPSLVNNKIGVIDSEEIISFLKNRQGKLDGIVFSGGECTIWGDKLEADIKFVKDMGYKVKIDTNGIRYTDVIKLIEKGLVDYVALDIKTSNKNPNYGLFHNTSIDYPFDNTFKLLKWLSEHDIPFETRTTVHPDISDEHEISNLLEQLVPYGIKKHYLQFFFETGETLGNVNQTPRYFNMSKVDTHGIEIGLRNENQNNRRKVLEIYHEQ